MISQDPGIWGAAAWRFLDAVVESYPENPSTALREEMTAFWNALYLPCMTCKDHYQEYRTEQPVEESVVSKNTLVSWYHGLKAQVHRSDDKDKEDKPNPPQPQWVQSQARRFQQERKNRAMSMAVGGGGMFRPTRAAAQRHDSAKPQGVCTVCGGVSSIRTVQPRLGKKK
jgi:hypothetical protein